MDFDSNIFHAVMIVLGIGLIGFGYSMIGHVDYYWSRFENRLRNRGRIPRRTPNWDQHTIIMGAVLMSMGFATMPFWFLLP